jgi:hypothetical protein
MESLELAPRLSRPARVQPRRGTMHAHSSGNSPSSARTAGVAACAGPVRGPRLSEVEEIYEDKWDIDQSVPFIGEGVLQSVRH